MNVWLALLGGPGYLGREARDRAVAEMRAAGAERLFPLLVPMLTATDPDARCKACEAVLWVDAGRAIELVLPLLDDRDAAVRWRACGCLHDFGDGRAVAPLVQVLQCDPDAQVRSWLTQSPTQFGFRTDLWTAARVAHLIRDRFGVAYRPSYLREWLTERGYSPQKPERQARQRKPEEVRAFLATTYPAVQRKSPGSTPTSP